MKTFFFIASLFFTCIVRSQYPYNLYYGNLHSHCEYSDGIGSPLRAFVYARDTADIDFLAVTDHMELLSESEWDSVKLIAANITQDGVFVGLAGYEWTSDNMGHCNVLCTPTKVSPFNILNWSAFAQSVIDELPLIAQFNHPGYPFGSNYWNSFSYLNSQADSAFALIEIVHYLEEVFYRMALDSNWHVSPTYNQDNHPTDWGTKDEGRTGIWAEDLSLNGLIAAMNCGRTFSSMDKNASVWLDVNGIPLGGHTVAESNTQLHFLLNDLDGESWSEIQIIGANNQIFLNLSNHTAFIDTTISCSTLSSKWLYLKAKQPDGQYVFSAPFYFSGTSTDISTNDGIDSYKLALQPNPVSVSSVISFFIDTEKNIMINLLDVSGRDIDILYNGITTPGHHTISLPYHKLNPGVYMLQFSDAARTMHIKVIR